MPGAKGNAGSRSWFEDAFGFSEMSYQETQRRFEMSGDDLVSTVNGARFHVGPFEVASVAELRARCSEAFDAATLGSLSFRNITGNARSLHLEASNAGAVFQVASQFNCLEMKEPGARPENGITGYHNDATQGPACALACPAATAYRNYLVNNGRGQGAGNQIDCLAAVAELVQNSKEKYWRMVNGYCLPQDPGSIGKLSSLIASDTMLGAEVRSRLQVGIHWDTEVKGKSHRVCQVFCSALPVAYAKSTKSLDWSGFACAVLDGTFEATLAAAAALAILRKARIKVYLTAVGGGAFGNRSAWIVAALEKALAAYAHFPLEVMLVHFGSIPRSTYAQLERGRHPRTAAFGTQSPDVREIEALQMNSTESPLMTTSPDLLEQAITLCMALDVDGCGLLSRRDLKAVLNKLEPSYQEEQVERVMIASDALDGDSVDYATFCRWLLCEGVAMDHCLEHFETSVASNKEALLATPTGHVSCSAMTPVVEPSPTARGALILGIAGATRCGKSTLAHILREKLPGNRILNQDAYFKAAGETPDCIDYRRLKKDLRNLISDAEEKAKASGIVHVVVIEGFLLFAEAELATMCQAKVFLDIDKDTCYTRRYESKAGGMDEKRFAKFFEKSIWPAHLQHGRPNSDDIRIFDGTRPSVEIANDVQAWLESALKKKPSAKADAVKLAVQQVTQETDRHLEVKGKHAAKKQAAKASSRPTPTQGKEDVLERILKAQGKTPTYKRALLEITHGHKSGHWIWYIWPTLSSLRPGTSRPEFLLPDLSSVQAYLRHDVLRERFVEITEVAIEHLKEGVAPKVLFGSTTDADKFVECMTVFASASGSSDDAQIIELCTSGLNAANDGRLHDRAVEVLSLRARTIKQLCRSSQ